MTRKSMLLGFALLVALSVGAPSALAQQSKLTADGPVTLIGTPKENDVPITLIGTHTGEGSSNTLTAFGGKTECTQATYTGHELGSTANPVPSGASTATITPHFGPCTALGFPATVDMNGCDFVIDLGKTTAGEGYAVGSTIVCPPGKDVTVKIFSSKTKHSEGASFCHLTITENIGSYAGLEAKNTEGHIGMAGTIAGITAHKKSPVGSILCPEETSNTVSLDHDVTFEGAKIQHGGEVGELIPSPTTDPNAFTAFDGKISCPDVVYTGHRITTTPHQTIPSGASAVTMTPHFGICDTSGLPSTVDMNGCDYALELGETAGATNTYGAKAKIVCPVGNDVKLTVFSSETHSAESRICTLTITENPAGYTGLHATDTASGAIDVDGTLEGITVHRSGGGILCPTATTETAKLDIDLLVEGRSGGGSATPVSLSEEPMPNVEGKLTSDGPVTLVGSPTGEVGANSLTAFGGKSECAQVKYVGHKVETTPHEMIPSGERVMTVTPLYGVCISLGFPSTVHMEGCDLEWTLGNTVPESKDSYSLMTMISCPPGRHITETIFTSQHNLSTGKPFCHMTLTENPAGYEGLIAQDTTNGIINVSGSIQGLHRDRFSPTGSILCPTEADTTASQHFDMKLEGFNGAGEKTPISLSDG